MNRILKILAVLLLGTCLVSAVLACSILRPRREVVSTHIEDGGLRDIPLRSRIQLTREWSLSPPWQWSIDRNGLAGCGRYSQKRSHGWQYGPFAFQEERIRVSWPIVIEKAARTMVVRKLGVKEPELDIQSADSPTQLIWHVVVSGPGGKRLEMDVDDQGKILPASVRK